MLTERERLRVENQLETFLAKVRPQPTQRSLMDVSYSLSVNMLVITEHRHCESTYRLLAHNLLKAVHSEDPAGWLLYTPDAEGQWQPCPEVVYVATLDEVLQLAESLLGEAPGEESLQDVG